MHARSTQCRPMACWMAVPKAFQEWRAVLWKIEHDPSLILLTRKMDQEYQDHPADAPCLDPQKAILFHSRHSWGGLMADFLPGFLHFV